MTRSTVIDSIESSRWRAETVLELNLGDVLRLRKAHPCGGLDWQVVRLGADIGLRCLTCNRRLLLERALLERRLKEFVFHAVEPSYPPGEP